MNELLAVLTLIMLLVVVWAALITWIVMRQNKELELFRDIADKESILMERICENFGDITKAYKNLEVNTQEYKNELTALNKEMVEHARMAIETSKYARTILSDRKQRQQITELSNGQKVIEAVDDTAGGSDNGADV